MFNLTQWNQAWLKGGQLAIFGLPTIKPEARFGLQPGEIIYAIGDTGKAGDPVQLFPTGLRYAGTIEIHNSIASVDAMLFQLEPNVHLCYYIFKKLTMPLKNKTLVEVAPVFTRKPLEQL